MTLGDVMEKLAGLVDLEVVIDDYGNYAGSFTDKDKIEIDTFRKCEVVLIDTKEDGTLVVTVDGNSVECV